MFRQGTQLEAIPQAPQVPTGTLSYLDGRTLKGFSSASLTLESNTVFLGLTWGSSKPVTFPSGIPTLIKSSSLQSCGSRPYLRLFSAGSVQLGDAMLIA